MNIETSLWKLDEKKYNNYMEWIFIWFGTRHTWSENKLYWFDFQGQRSRPSTMLGRTGCCASFCSCIRLMQGDSGAILKQWDAELDEQQPDLSQLGMSPPRWRRGSGLDCRSEDPGSIPSLSSPRVGPLMARGLKTSSDVPVPVSG